LVAEEESSDWEPYEDYKGHPILSSHNDDGSTDELNCMIAQCSGEQDQPPDHLEKTHDKQDTEVSGRSSSQATATHSKIRREFESPGAQIDDPLDNEESGDASNIDSDTIMEQYVSVGSKEIAAEDKSQAPAYEEKFKLAAAKEKPEVPDAEKKSEVPATEEKSKVLATEEKPEQATAEGGMEDPASGEETEDLVDGEETVKQIPEEKPEAQSEIPPASGGLGVNMNDDGPSTKTTPEPGLKLSFTEEHGSPLQNLASRDGPKTLDSDADPEFKDAGEVTILEKGDLPSNTPVSLIAQREAVAEPQTNPHSGHQEEVVTPSSPLNSGTETTVATPSSADLAIEYHEETPTRHQARIGFPYSSDKLDRPNTMQAPPSEYSDTPNSEDMTALATSWLSPPNLMHLLYTLFCIFWVSITIGFSNFLSSRSVIGAVEDQEVSNIQDQQSNSEKFSTLNKLEKQLIEQKKTLLKVIDIAPLHAQLSSLKVTNYDGCLAESKKYLNNVKKYEATRSVNQDLSTRMTMARYSQLKLIGNLVKVENLTDLIKDFEWNSLFASRREEIFERKVEIEFLEEQTELFRRLLIAFEGRYQSLKGTIQEEYKRGRDLATLIAD